MHYNNIRYYSTSPFGDKLDFVSAVNKYLKALARPLAKFCEKYRVAAPAAPDAPDDNNPCVPTVRLP